VVIIEHAGDAVETEPVHPVLVEPEAAVGKQEMENLGFLVVKAPGIPGPMSTPGPFMEILVRGPSNLPSPSTSFATEWEWTMSMSTVSPEPWAVSMRALRSSGVPNREEAAKKFDTWYPKEP
jgi:hypothetical protein